jgi:rare lipoprotein A
MRTLKFIAIPLIFYFLAGCSSKGRYDLKHDIAPTQPPALDHVEDAHPQYEPYSRGGNKDYSLRGNHYKIVKNPTAFTEEGLASWYGKKFHGHMTSNGEIYDMYSMSAAHKTLPLPSYVRVKNLDNGKTAIVRINDRGPFHPGRIIDLSYAAAYKLGVIQTGTAHVKITAIPVNKTKVVKHPPNAKNIDDYVVQVSASKDLDRTRTLSQTLSQRLSVASFVDSSKSNHRVLLGPFNDYDLTQQTLEQVKMLGYDTAFIRKYAATQ